MGSNLASFSGRGGIDLHIHSTASDGTLTPVEIVVMARSIGLAAISVTDHDTVEGTRQALEANKEGGLVLVPGVEISAEIPHSFAGTGCLHILGYFVKTQNPALREALAALSRARRDRNPRIIRRLRGAGVNISYEEVLALAGEGQVGRPHIARVLLAKGMVSSMEEAFDRYLAKGRLGYVEKYRLPVQSAIQVIREAGGVAVLAHPCSLEMDEDKLLLFLKRLKDMGLGGIEVLYPSHDAFMVAACLRMARELELAVTGGTDFHGANKPAIKMGTGKGKLHVPFSLYENLADLAQKRAPGAA